MPEPRPNWREEALCKLADSKLSRDEREEISRELAGYLEDLCADAPARDLHDRVATESAAAELHEDKHLGATLYRARRENAMHLNDRTRHLWLPGITSLFASAALLAAFQAAALWTYHAYAPTPHAQNYPDLVHNLMRHNGAALMIYFGWLYTLPFLGALGAYRSRRSGGNRLAQITTGLFPLVLFLAIFSAQWGGAERNTFAPYLGMDSLPPTHIFFPFLSGSSNLFLSWLAIPGAALLLGVLPFAWKSGIRGHDSAASTAPAWRNDSCA
jgi:hypothetical protein